jgi:hypothetical protein
MVVLGMGARPERLEEAVRTGRPPTYSAGQRSAVITAAPTRPAELGLPFACWTLDRLVTYLSDQGIAIGYRFPAKVISYAVWLYFRFPLSLRMVEEMLALRGIVDTPVDDPGFWKVSAKPDRPCPDPLVGPGPESRLVEPPHQPVRLLGVFQCLGGDRVVPRLPGLGGFAVAGIPDRLAGGLAGGLFSSGL